MNQNDRTGLIPVFTALLVAIVFGLAMDIGGRLDTDQLIVTLTPDLGVLFGADIITSTMLAALFGDLTVGMKLLFDS